MAQTKDERKRIAIRDAVIIDIVENGLGHSPVANIARRAGVSAGTIYIYYANKEQMLQAIFLEIKSMLHREMMSAYQSGTNAKEGLRAMWLAMFDFMLANPNMFAFHEILASENILGKEQREEIAAMASEIRNLLQSAADDGTLKAMPIDCLIALYIAPSVHLARRMIEGNARDREKAEQVFQMIWDGIAR